MVPDSRASFVNFVIIDLKVKLKSLKSKLPIISSEIVSNEVELMCYKCDRKLSLNLQVEMSYNKSRNV